MEWGPPADRAWLIAVVDFLDSRCSLRSRNRPPDHVQWAALGARFAWTTELRRVIIHHTCGHFSERRIPLGELEARMPEYAAERCPACDPEGFWNR